MRTVCCGDGGRRGRVVFDILVGGKQLSDLLGKRGALTAMEYLQGSVRCVCVYLYLYVCLE